MRIIGLDTSLTSTGVAVLDFPANGGAPAVNTGTLKPPAKLRDVARLRWLLSAVISVVGQDADLVVMEAPAFGTNTGSAHERAGLWWMVATAIEYSSPVAIPTPQQLKKYATGSGNAGKDEVVLATARRFAGFEGDNNAADALWLAAFGAVLVGCPVVDMPAKNMEAVQKFDTGKRPWLSERRPTLPVLGAA